MVNADRREEEEIEEQCGQDRRYCGLEKSPGARNDQDQEQVGEPHRRRI
jgi:hypothetical protein